MFVVAEIQNPKSEVSGLEQTFTCCKRERETAGGGDVCCLDLHSTSLRLCAGRQGTVHSALFFLFVFFFFLLLNLQHTLW